MSWEDEIKKNNKNNDSYKKMLDILRDEFKNEVLESGETLKKILKLMVEFDDREAIDEIRPFILKHNDALLSLDEYLDQVTDEIPDNTNQNLFDEDEWRREMR